MTTTADDTSSAIVDTARLTEIEAEILATAAAAARHRARLLRLIGDFDAAGGWVATGAISSAHWLADLLDIETCTAREHVRVARALRELPLVRERLEAGEISYAKVRQLTRVATIGDQRELLELAARRPAGELARALSAWQHHHDPDALRRRQIDGRSVTFRSDPCGNTVITVVLAPEQAAEVEALIDVEVLRLPVMDAPADVSAGRPSLAQRRADGLCRLVAKMAVGDRRDAPEGVRGGPRVELIVHRRVGQAELDDGTPLHPSVAKQLTCDADVRVMTHYLDGSPADVGRRHRLVTPRLRRLVRERVGGRCEHPGCRARNFLQIHHVVHWEDGGGTDLANLVLLCGHHHRWAHHGALRPSRRDRVTFRPSQCDGADPH